MSGRLANKRALVTAAGAGIGRATAIAFAEAGAHVLATDIDEAALVRWKAYSNARNEMFARTHNIVAPWTVVRADDKPLARISVIKDILTRLEYDGKDEEITLPNPDVVFGYHEDCLKKGLIAQ